jgi:formylmethanofuran dehydrogenase subunit D
MPSKRFLLIPGRTSKQGQEINVGKDNEAYQTIVNTLTMNAADMK